MSTINSKMRALSQKAAAKRLSHSQSKSVELVRKEVDPTSEILESSGSDVKNLGLSWTKKAEDALNGKYSCNHLSYLSRHKEKQQKEVLELTPFFLPITNSSSAETEIELDEESDSADEVESKEEFKSRVKDAIIDLSKFAVSVISLTSEQQKLGVAEIGKYKEAYHYLYALINMDMKKMTASKFVSDIVYKQKSAWYRAHKICQHAKKYLETRRISLGTQGKHAKRVSVLDNEDIK
ncbi:hypothetical protein PHYBLDRAFT_68717 [Phycomyces blakesleeanus NRRL 1555(-)]|uniref:Uncharacterized protein n=1 Tax=Phycomyces blakesleeanus (strain ATCC 8743b / DSM 1359 / FGSC 10004 / NBRC 33097 / NRRL 1555) TaxID=763407 RepID=A0A167M769_PHYB8|nr:hypothetical protein PHYBLDRAFT_68717 [Phycomyces blakesleeanus NRRL 1555(-)]OAD72007.1 hypothetical protein PHYBLDRAFT_68717 [Phycomyces blakesleeanus NRRL 1555(-)]|eukprot:XP_018290047.1 hypothetical protein PHYBLDRAFT_68717 [Phycomyces blakesleeanus NRRL 1555(-)]